MWRRQRVSRHSRSNPVWTDIGGNDHWEAQPTVVEGRKPIRPHEFNKKKEAS